MDLKKNNTMAKKNTEKILVRFYREQSHLLMVFPQQEERRDGARLCFSWRDGHDAAPLEYLRAKCKRIMSITAEVRKCMTDYEKEYRCKLVFDKSKRMPKAEF